MTPNENKPEWFQMADADASPRHNLRRRVRILALSAPLVMISAGLVYAQTQNEAPATATETVAPANVESPQTTNVQPTQNSTQSNTAPTKSVAAKTVSTIHSTAKISKASETSAATPSPVLTPPSIQKPTSGGGNDDGVEGQEGGEHSKKKNFGTNPAKTPIKPPTPSGEDDNGGEGDD